MSNVLSEAKKQQVIALGRLGWPLRRIEQETGVCRETAGAYLKAVGIGVRPPGAWGRRPPAKPANENQVTTGSDAAKPTHTINPNPNPETLSNMHTRARNGVHLEARIVPSTTAPNSYTLTVEGNTPVDLSRPAIELHIGSDMGIGAVKLED